MAEIVPNSEFLILKDVPIESDYTNSLYWANAKAQSTYFVSKTKYSLNEQQYQRHASGIMRVGIKADELLDCNYLMFRNTAFGSKWFYAFIDDVEYVNNEVSRIHYTIDVMQTWYFETDFSECLVDRETAQTDGLFQNLVPENLATGEYILQENVVNINLLDKGQSVVFFFSYNQPDSTSDIPVFPIYEGTIINGVFMGLNYSILPLNTALITQFLQGLTATQSVIAGVAQIPSSLVNQNQFVMDTRNEYLPLPASFNADYHDTPAYVPKNKKLFSYPYMYILASNNSGATTTYNWEDFDNSMAQFEVQGTLLTNAEYAMYPKNYKGLETGYEYGIVYNDFVNPPYSQDSFTAWWNINKQAFITSCATAAANAATEVATAAGGIKAMQFYNRQKAGLAFAQEGAGVGQQLSTAANNIAGAYTEYKSHKLAPDSISQFAAVPALRMAQNRCSFSLYSMGIKPEMARVIDDYFTRFGYAQNKLAVPQRHNNRLSYHYVRTHNCTITGSVPAVYEKQICDIMNNGITWWDNPAKVGNYN